MPTYHNLLPETSNTDGPQGVPLILRGVALAVLRFLADESNADGFITVPKGDIIEALRLRMSCLSRALSVLENIGAIEAFRESGHSNTYRIIQDPRKAEPGHTENLPLVTHDFAVRELRVRIAPNGCLRIEQPDPCSDQDDWASIVVRAEQVPLLVTWLQEATRRAGQRPAGMPR